MIKKKFLPKQAKNNKTYNNIDSKFILKEKKESDEEVNEMAFSWNKMLASLKQQLIQPQQPKESEASKEAPKPNIKRKFK